ncbi:hypothetical protein K2X40_05490 [Candidatus Babeliales bacterium]|nr:hypothetical protein [Candidatus Babeliales bacterium]
MYKLYKNNVLRSGIAAMLIAGFCSLNLDAAAEKPDVVTDNTPTEKPDTATKKPDTTKEKVSGEEKTDQPKKKDRYSRTELAQIATAALRGPALLANIYHEKKGNVKAAAVTTLLVDALRISNGVLALLNTTTNNQSYNLAWLGYDAYALSTDLVNLITSFDEPKKPQPHKELHQKVDKLLISIRYIIAPLTEWTSATFSALKTDNPGLQAKADALTSCARMSSLYLASKPKSLEAKLKLALLGLSAWAAWNELSQPKNAQLKDDSTSPDDKKPGDKKPGSSRSKSSEDKEQTEEERQAQLKTKEEEEEEAADKQWQADALKDEAEYAKVQSRIKILKKREALKEAQAELKRLTEPAPTQPTDQTKTRSRKSERPQTQPTRRST